jgi:hypothetical protein
VADPRPTTDEKATSVVGNSPIAEPGWTDRHVCSEPQGSFLRISIALVGNLQNLMDLVSNDTLNPVIRDRAVQNDTWGELTRHEFDETCPAV